MLVVKRAFGRRTQTLRPQSNMFTQNLLSRLQQVKKVDYSEEDTNALLERASGRRTPTLRRLLV